jgi:hypothetical protein
VQNRHTSLHEAQTHRKNISAVEDTGWGGRGGGIYLCWRWNGCPPAHTWQRHATPPDAPFASAYGPQPPQSHHRQTSRSQLHGRQHHLSCENKSGKGVCLLIFIDAHLQINFQVVCFPTCVVQVDRRGTLQGAQEAGSILAHGMHRCRE